MDLKLQSILQEGECPDQIALTIQRYRILRPDLLKFFNDRKLTPAQMAVSFLSYERKTCKQIGRALFVEEKTVNNHRYVARRKLGIPLGHSFAAFLLSWVNA